MPILKYTCLHITAGCSWTCTSYPIIFTALRRNNEVDVPWNVDGAPGQFGDTDWRYYLFILTEGYICLYWLKVLFVNIDWMLYLFILTQTEGNISLY